MVDADLFDRAFCELQEFGPRRAIAVEVRWREVLPGLNPTEYWTVRRRCEAIESFAYDLADQVHAGTLAAETACSRIGATYPELTAERVSRVWNQAMYFASK